VFVWERKCRSEAYLLVATRSTKIVDSDVRPIRLATNNLLEGKESCGRLKLSSDILDGNGQENMAREKKAGHSLYECMR
jgi:hypothetical protein